MTFTVSHIRPDRTAEIISTDRHSSVTASIKAAMHLFSVAKGTDHPASARVFGQALLTEYTRANSALPEGHPLGAELVHESGHTYRIDDSGFPPNICPCCSALVRPDASLYAGDDDTYCDGCYPYARETPQCLPANSAHPDED